MPYVADGEKPDEKSEEGRVTKMGSNSGYLKTRLSICGNEKVAEWGKKLGKETVEGTIGSVGWGCK